MKTPTADVSTNTSLRVSPFCSRFRLAHAVGLLVLLILVSPAMVQAQFEYTTNYDGTITITWCNDPIGAVAIPSIINGRRVTNIGEGAFSSDSGLTSITIPNSVTSIGQYAFESCTFLTDVTIPNGVTNIADGVFDECTRLSSVAIPSSVTGIGRLVFYRCTSLPTITVDPLNSVYSSVDGVLFNKGQTRLLEYPAGKSGSYLVPNGVTRIGTNAFDYCPRLTSVTIPSTATRIDDWAFRDCASLTNIVIPNSVTSIASEVFSGCSGLTSFTIPGSVISVGGYLFGECTSLTSVTISNNVITAGGNAFYRCTGLTNVTILSSTTSIGFYTFNQCTNLTSIVVPKSVSNIVSSAFYLCTNLKRVLFQGNAPSIGSSVFYGDTNAIIYYLPGTTGWGKTFDICPTALWNPKFQVNDSGFGVRTNRFGFKIVGTTNIPIVLEACTNLTGQGWQPLQSCNLTNGSLYFGDSTWTNYSGRFYRIRWP